MDGSFEEDRQVGESVPDSFSPASVAGVDGDDRVISNSRNVESTIAGNAVTDEADGSHHISSRRQQIHPPLDNEKQQIPTSLPVPGISSLCLSLSPI
jgi:hypothetical protein